MPEEDGKLADYFKGFLEDEMKQRPLEATRLGDHRYDDRLEDLSAERGPAGWHATRRRWPTCPARSNMRSCRAGQIDFEIFKHWLAYQVWQLENSDRFKDDPRVYNDYITESVFLLLTQSTEAKPTTLKNCAARIGRIPAVVAAARANLGNPPRMSRRDGHQAESGCHPVLQGRHLPGGRRDAPAERTEGAFRPGGEGLEEHQRFLEGGAAASAKGEWRIGKEKFARKLELELDSGLTAEQVLEEAEREFERVEREMYVIARQLWAQAYPGKPLPADDGEGRRATIRQVLAHYNREHGKGEELVKDARASVDRIKSFIEERDILRLPDPDRCRIMEMPEFQRGNSVAYLNPAPPLDARVSSIYAISPPPREWDTRLQQSFLEEYNRYMLQMLTIHEAYPGHYVQLEYSNRHPSLIRKVLSSGTFAEGWAVYTEQMMLDQGYGEGGLAAAAEPAEVVSAGSGQRRPRSPDARLGHDRRGGAEFLTGRAFQSEGEAGQDHPGQAKLVSALDVLCRPDGLLPAEAASAARAGRQVRAGRFHEAALDHGTLPVKYLPELVRERLSRPR